MISEQDKQAILNGAWFIRTESFIKRAKLISIREGEYPYIVIEERHKGDKVIDDDDLPYIVNAWPSLGAIGLWQDKPEPFDLERAELGENKMIKANNFVNILDATINMANALGYGCKLFVKSYEFPEGELKIVLTTEDGKELTFKVEVKSKEEEMQQNTINQIENWFKTAVPNPTDSNKRVQIGCHLEEMREMLGVWGGFEELDALCDQIVTAIGVAHMSGMDIQGALQEVANSNDSKFEERQELFQAGTR